MNYLRMYGKVKYIITIDGSLLYFVNSIELTIAKNTPGILKIRFPIVNEIQVLLKKGASVVYTRGYDDILYPRFHGKIDSIQNYANETEIIVIDDLGVNWSTENVFEKNLTYLVVLKREFPLINFISTIPDLIENTTVSISRKQLIQDFILKSYNLYCDYSTPPILNIHLINKISYVPPHPTLIEFPDINKMWIIKNSLNVSSYDSLDIKIIFSSIV